MRTPVSLTAVFEAGDRDYKPEVALFALCDDGSIWQSTNIYEPWIRLPDIPQDAPEGGAK